MKRKYRIKELVHADGTSTFVPQYKEFLLWRDWYSLDLVEDPPRIECKTREKAEDFLTKKIREEQQIRKWENGRRVVAIKEHPFFPEESEARQ